MTSCSHSSLSDSKRTDAPPTELAGGWPLVWALAIAQLVSWGSIFYGFSLFLVPMERELGWSRALLNGAFSAGLLMQGLCAYPAGAWIDRNGGRWLMAFGSLLSALLLALWSQVNSAIIFYVIWIGLGACMAANLYDPAFAVLVRGFHNSFRRRINVLTLTGGFASTLFIPLTQILIAAFGWRHALLALAVTNLIIAFPIHAFWLRDGNGAVASKAPAPDVTANGSGLHRALRHPVFWLLVLSFTAYYLAYTALIVHIIPLLTDRGYTSALIVSAMALFGPMQVAGRLMLLLFGAEVRSEVFGLVVLLAMPVATLLLIAFPASGVIPYLFAAILGAGNGLVTILRGICVPDLMWREDYGAINGAITLPSSIARAAAPLATALVWQISGSYSLALWVLLGFACLAALAFWLAVAVAARGKRHR